LPDEITAALSPVATLLAICHFCGETLTGDTATCNNCQRTFHLRHRENGDGRDCGEVWISEQHLSLEFACDVCLGKRLEHGAEEPPVGRGH
jgi:hypothetical protein